MENSFLDLCYTEQKPDQELNFSDFPIPSPYPFSPQSFNRRKSVLDTIDLPTSQKYLETPEQSLSDVSEDMSSTLKSLIEEQSTSNVSKDAVSSFRNSPSNSPSENVQSSSSRLYSGPRI